MYHISAFHLLKKIQIKISRKKKKHYATSRQKSEAPFRLEQSEKKTEHKDFGVLLS